ncbi:ERF family protein [Streptomyces sp. NPDC048436]|uniref:ERF family protein n=1 Tax=Streptomyces sp. NPDC048436 TaxID=3365550 RepID=UPI0037196C62
MTVTTLPTARPEQRTTTPTLAAVPAADVVYVPAPEGAPADSPRVFAAINAVMCDAMPVGKNQRNEQQNYNFRGIDDVMSAMAGPMRAHGVFILPTIASHTQSRDGKMTRTLITMRYRVYGPAGDCLVADVPGEAFDYADKSMNKAQSAALKYFLFALFMLPVDSRSIDDGDRHHPEPTPEQRAEQQQRQQRQQGRQQRGQQRQQPRRGNRAEPGPWEQSAAQGQEQTGPRSDYLAHAERATTRDQFAKIRAAAVADRAPADYLAKLDAVAARKTAEQGQQQTPPPNSPKSPEAAAADAENVLRLAASRANLPTLDADFERAYGLPIEQAAAAQLDQFRAMIENAGGVK